MMKLRMDDGLNVIARVGLGRKQLFHFAPQLQIAAATFLQQRGTLNRIALESAMKQTFDLLPALCVQGRFTRFAFGDAAKLPPFSNPCAP